MLQCAWEHIRKMCRNTQHKWWIKYKDVIKTGLSDLGAWCRSLEQKLRSDHTEAICIHSESRAVLCSGRGDQLPPTQRKRPADSAEQDRQDGWQQRRSAPPYWPSHFRRTDRVGQLSQRADERYALTQLCDTYQHSFTPHLLLSSRVHKQGLSGHDWALSVFGVSGRCLWGWSQWNHACYVDATWRRSSQERGQSLVRQAHAGQCSGGIESLRRLPPWACYECDVCPTVQQDQLISLITEGKWHNWRN